MRLIHCADLHLGAPMASRLGKDKAAIRKGELRGAFSAMVDYAAREGIGLILLCGDVFDSDHPARRDKEFFYSVVKNNPSIDFLYLRGNHDQASAYHQELPNLKTFGSQWDCYRYGDLAIWGLELAAQNAATLYAALKPRPQDKNIVLLHGQVADAPGPGRIALNRLREKYIDYLALGHLHSYASGALDSRGIWCYPGCLEGRGYDEPGPKGFVVLDTQDLKSPCFQPQSRRQIRRLEVDATGCEDLYALCRLVEQQLPQAPQDLLRLELVGRLSWDTSGLAQELRSRLEGRYFHSSVKDLTKRGFDVERYAQELSLAGEFVRQVMAQEDLTQEQRQQVLDLGLRALAGEEVGLCI